MGTRRKADPETAEVSEAADNSGAANLGRRPYNPVPDADTGSGITYMTSAQVAEEERIVAEYRASLGGS